MRAELLVQGEGDTQDQKNSMSEGQIIKQPEENWGNCVPRAKGLGKGGGGSEAWEVNLFTEHLHESNTILGTGWRSTCIIMASILLRSKLSLTDAN